MKVMQMIKFYLQKMKEKINDLDFLDVMAIFAYGYAALLVALVFVSSV